MSAQYETTLIITPVLTDAELKKLTSNYVKSLKSDKAEIVHENHWGLRQLAYPIKNKTTGFYFTFEYKADPALIAKLEVDLKRDENVLRFLTIKLDKYSIDYNERKRNGLIGRKAQKEQASAEDGGAKEKVKA